MARFAWRPRLLTVGLVPLSLSFWACTAPRPPSWDGPTAQPGGAHAPVTAASVNAPPEWRPGDRWVYEWTSGSDSGIKIVEILENKQVNGVQYWVARVSGVEHYELYTRDLHWAAAVRNSTIEARMVPPRPWFVWPLEVGRRWGGRGTFEDRGGRKLHDDRFTVLTAETVEVPAGRFRAFKVIRETDAGDSDAYWYVPEVRWYVRWAGRRADIQFEERLREYQAPRTIQPSDPKLLPSKTK